MKISIQHEDITSYIEFEDYDIYDFAEHLRGLLHTVWLPEQVNKMMPTEESLNDEFVKVRREAYDEGYRDGEAANAKSAETIYEEGKAKGYAEGRAEGYEEGKEKWVEGYAAGKEKWVEGYETGYEDGKAEGHEAGYSEGYATAAAETLC